MNSASMHLSFCPLSASPIRCPPPPFNSPGILLTHVVRHHRARLSPCRAGARHHTTCSRPAKSGGRTGHFRWKRAVCSFATARRQATRTSLASAARPVSAVLALKANLSRTRPSFAAYAVRVEHDGGARALFVRFL